MDKHYHRIVVQLVYLDGVVEIYGVYASLIMESLLSHGNRKKTTNEPN